jgi:hypothetical protein
MRSLEATSPTVTREGCRDHYAPNGAEIFEEHLCVGLEEGGRDSCQGDSGGPLVSNWLKDRDNVEQSQDKKESREPPQSFTDRIAALLAKDDGGRSRHRR